MVEREHEVSCFDRSVHHVSGERLGYRKEYNDVKTVPAWMIVKKGLAAMMSSLSAASVQELGRVMWRERE